MLSLLHAHAQIRTHAHTHTCTHATQEGPHIALNEDEFFDALEMAYQNDENEQVSISMYNMCTACVHTPTCTSCLPLPSLPIVFLSAMKAYSYHCLSHCLLRMVNGWRATMMRYVCVCVVRVLCVCVHACVCVCVSLCECNPA